MRAPGCGVRASEDCGILASSSSAACDAVATFASVAVGHPDGLYGLAVGHADEVALGAVDGSGGLDDLGQADGVAFGGEGLAEGLGEGGDLVERGDALAVKGFVELGGTVGLLAEALSSGR